MRLNNDRQWFGCFKDGFLYKVECFNFHPSLFDFNVAILGACEYEIREVFVEF